MDHLDSSASASMWTIVGCFRREHLGPRIATRNRLSAPLSLREQ